MRTRRKIRHRPQMRRTPLRQRRLTSRRIIQIKSLNRRRRRRRIQLPDLPLHLVNRLQQFIPLLVIQARIRSQPLIPVNQIITLLLQPLQGQITKPPHHLNGNPPRIRHRQRHRPIRATQTRLRVRPMLRNGTNRHQAPTHPGTRPPKTPTRRPTRHPTDPKRHAHHRRSHGASE